VGVRYQVDSPHGGQVRIFYDRDGVAGSGDETWLITLPVPTAATTWVWTSPALPLGTYHVGVEVNDGINDPVVAYAAGLIQELGPTVTVTAPTGVTNWVNGGTVNVTYTAYATTGTATLFYDVDGQPNTGDEVFVGGAGLVQSGVSTTRALTVAVLANGTYHVGVQVTDGTTTAWGYAPGTINVTGPTLAITSPVGPAPTPVGAGAVLPVVISYQCDGQASQVRVFYDTDTTYDTANETARQLATKQEAATSGAPASDTIGATIPLIPQGTYYIGASLWVSGVLKATAYSTSPLAVSGPTLVLTSPAVDVRVQPGGQVTIAWSNTLPGLTPKITLWYDVDQTYTPAVDDPHQIVTDHPVIPPGKPGDSYIWTLPISLLNPPSGGYYIGATVTDDLNQKTTVYSLGRVIVLDRTFYSLWLGDVEAKRWGRTFRGLAPNGQLGAVATHIPWTRFKVDPKDALGQTLMRQPGISTNAVGGVDVPAGTGPARTYDDFVLVAPHATPYYLTRPSAGEAYLILSDPTILFTVPAVGNFEPIYVTATGTAILPGVIFAGPACSSANGNSGIGDVAISRPAKSDTAPDILFGIPKVQHIFQEEQDYDPWDFWVYDYMASLNIQGFPRSAGDNFNITYSDSYRPPTGTAADGGGPGISVDGTEPTKQGAWNKVTAGMIIAVSSTTVNNPNPITAATGSAPGQQILIPLDNVGQVSSEPHPRVVSNSYSPYATNPPVAGSNLLGPKGLRYYGPWWLTLFGTPQYHQYQKFTMSSAVTSPNDLSQFGRNVIEADLDGDGKPEWISLQPYDPETGAVAGSISTTGLIHIQWTDKSQLWDTPLDQLTLQGGGQVRFRPVTRTITIDVGGTTTTTTYGAYTTVTAPIAPDVTFCQRVYSWPYAVHSIAVSADLATTTTTNNTVNPATTTIAYTVEDQNPGGLARDRQYCWPMVSDTLRGETGALLSGLANAGDFNADNHEDFTIGSPTLNTNAGASYLVFGQSQYGDLGLNNIGATAPVLPGLKIVGTAGSLLGTWQASAGDVNGDGVSDWIIGAPGYNGGQGAAAVVFGDRYRQGVYQFADIGTPKLPGIRLVGETAGDNAGLAVAGVGDIDGDGYDDFVVVSQYASWTVNGGPRKGVAYVVYGSPTLYNSTDPTKNNLSLANVGTAVLPGVLFIGTQDQAAGVAGLGSVAPAGDVDDDGYADFLIGNPNFDVRDPTGTVIQPKTGEVYLIRGGPRFAP
jgi:hypothetical protein